MIRSTALRTLLCALLAGGATAAECGDCNGDALYINVLDALDGARIASGLLAPTPQLAVACDVDKSGAVDVIDSLLMAQASVGLPISPMCPPLPFTQEAEMRGIDYECQQARTWGTGGAFADLDGDGDPDLILAGRETPFPGQTTTLGIYENDGTGHFTLRDPGPGVPPFPAGNGTTAADYDGDGDLDIHIASHTGADGLLRNDGGFVFTNVAAAAGIDEQGAGQGCAWADFDGDTWLDLYVANRTWSSGIVGSTAPRLQANRLWRNRGDGTFEDVAVAQGVDRGDDPTYQAAFFDYDRDGDPDLYLATDKGAARMCSVRNHLFENVGGTFVDVSTASGADGCIDAMCIAFGDLDRNGYLDIYVTNTPYGNVLYLNQGNGTFLDEAATYGVASYAIGWGSSFLDWDNDGWLDIYTCQHYGVYPPNRLYDFNGTPPTTEISALVAVDDPEESFCSAVADIDNDGDLDILVCDRLANFKLYVNHEGSRHSWIKLRVSGMGANLFGVGTSVEVQTGTTTQLREVIAGSSFKNQDDLTLHFGLDSATVTDEIRVFWPGGATRTLTGYAAGQTWTLFPTPQLGDVDQDGRVDLADFLVFATCYGGPVTPGCECFDMDGDATLDATDAAAFLAAYADPLEDCNANMVPDLQDILAGTSLDANQNGVPDECEP